jgi:uncharacterized protein YndB with AHSA1/START domain
MSLVVTPVHKILELDCPVEKAFATFTEGIAVWWPIEMHSVYGEGGTAVFASDRIYEVGPDGQIAEWGRVSVWDPPHRVVTTWHPGSDPATATELELRFTPLDDGRTRFELLHRGWEALGEAAERMRNNYDTGWDAVLERYRP